MQDILRRISVRNYISQRQCIFFAHAYFSCTTREYPVFLKWWRVVVETAGCCFKTCNITTQSPGSKLQGSLLSFAWLVTKKRCVSEYIFRVYRQNILLVTEASVSVVCRLLTANTLVREMKRTDRFHFILHFTFPPKLLHTVQMSNTARNHGRTIYLKNTYIMIYILAQLAGVLKCR